MSRVFFCFFTVCLIVVLSCGSGNNPNNNESQKTSSETATTLEAPDADKADTEGEENESTYSNEAKNNLPQVTSIKIIDAAEDDLTNGFRVVVEAKDLDGDQVSLRYQWKRNGEDIAGAVNEVLEWREDFKKGDSISIQVIPFDGKEEGVWKTEGTFTIPNSPPKIVSAPEARMEGGKFIYTVKAEDRDGDPVELTLKNTPEGMTLEPATGVIVWEFGENDVGEYRPEIVASDPEGAEDVQILTLTVPSETP